MENQKIVWRQLGDGRPMLDIDVKPIIKIGEITVDLGDHSFIIWDEDDDTFIVSAKEAQAACSAALETLKQLVRQGVKLRPENQ